MRSVLLSLSHRKSLGRLATKVPVTRRMVGRFVAGETMEEALPAIERLHEQGMRTTVDVLGESVDRRGRRPRGVRPLPRRRSTPWPPRGLDRNVSLKPSQMGAKIDEALARENIGAVVAKAIETGAFVRIDMEDHRYTDRTLDLWRELRPADRSNGADVGVVIQAALRRSEQDVEAIIAEGGRDPAVQRRLQGARVGRLPGQGRGRRGVRAADAPPAPLAGPTRRSRPTTSGHQARASRSRPRRALAATRSSSRCSTASGATSRSELVRAGWRRPRLRPVRRPVVSVLHAPPGRAAGQRLVPAAQPVAGARAGLTPGPSALESEEPPVCPAAQSIVTVIALVTTSGWSGPRRTPRPALRPRNMTARVTYHLRFDFIRSPLHG